jgi:hypothetical protein
VIRPADKQENGTMDDLAVPTAMRVPPVPPQRPVLLADRLAALFGLPVPSPAPDILDAARRLKARPAPLVLVRAVLGLPADAGLDAVLAALAALDRPEEEPR